MFEYIDAARSVSSLGAATTCSAERAYFRLLSEITQDAEPQNVSFR